MGAAIKAINDVNCSHVNVNASDCASIGRQDCGTGTAPPDNVCGLCLDNYVGPYGYSNKLACNSTESADRRRLELEDHFNPYSERALYNKREARRRRLATTTTTSYTDGHRTDLGSHKAKCYSDR